MRYGILTVPFALAAAIALTASALIAVAPQVYRSLPSIEDRPAFPLPARAPSDSAAEAVRDAGAQPSGPAEARVSDQSTGPGMTESEARAGEELGTSAPSGSAAKVVPGRLPPLDWTDDRAPQFPEKGPQPLPPRP